MSLWKRILSDPHLWPFFTWVDLGLFVSIPVIYLIYMVIFLTRFW